MYRKSDIKSQYTNEFKYCASSADSVHDFNENLEIIDEQARFNRGKVEILFLTKILLVEKLNHTPYRVKFIIIYYLINHPKITFYRIVI